MAVDASIPPGAPAAAGPLKQNCEVALSVKTGMPAAGPRFGASAYRQRASTPAPPAVLGAPAGDGWAVGVAGVPEGRGVAVPEGGAIAAVSVQNGSATMAAPSAALPSSPAPPDALTRRPAPPRYCSWKSKLCSRSGEMDTAAWAVRAEPSSCK
eukprot:scaffold10045_cov114-Isochrysis_galbana.AAC.1